MKCKAGGGAIYGVGVIGALIYFLQHAHSAFEVFTGLVYAVFWPGVMVYKALELLKY